VFLLSKDRLEFIYKTPAIGRLLSANKQNVEPARTFLSNVYQKKEKQ